MGPEQYCCASCVRLLLKSWSTVLAVGLAECGVAMCWGRARSQAQKGYAPLLGQNQLTQCGHPQAIELPAMVDFNLTQALEQRAAADQLAGWVRLLMSRGVAGRIGRRGRLRAMGHFGQAVHASILNENDS